MIASRRRRNDAALALALVVGPLLFGVLVAKNPFAALGLMGVGLVAALAFLAPVAHLVTLIVLTAIVPYGLQNRFGIGGGQGSPGLLLSDVLLLFGLLRGAVTVLGQPLDRRRTLSLVLILGFLTLATAQFAHGISAGRAVSTAGAELRALLGFGVFIVALPIIADAPQRARLIKALPIVGIVLGVWGIAQWVLQIPFSLTGDVGVREGVGLTAAGKGQIQGGLFAFPVAIVMAVAALTLKRELSKRSLSILTAVILLNSISLLLTYERTFWIATVLGCGFVILRTRRGERARVLLIVCVGASILLAILSTLAPAELATARERVLSLGQYGQDNSVRYRLTESRVVLEQIHKHPLVGSGLAATVFWGRPYEQVLPASYTYSHNGYLWLAWKLGLPGTLLLLGLILLALTPRGAPAGGPVWLALRNGAQGTLVVLLLASVTFPSFNGQGITPTMGLLFAICALPIVVERRAMPAATIPVKRSTANLELALSRR